ncbi:MAG: hydrogenase iron-sulfur subunit [Chloroflexota bacterium]|jgi:F420-non-reducing hydrogenase iron-sulfur subunit|nr:hydrogenase iron-sulfur subunit [Chloroflexota bacterium]
MGLVGSSESDTLMEYKPKIALFQCLWCLFSEADQYWVDHNLPSSIHLAKLSCTGRINPLYILNAIQGGVDGIMISGCLPEKCHFKEGNLSALRQHDAFLNLLDYIGFDRERVRFVWLDLQDLGRIQRELADFEVFLKELQPEKQLATRVSALSGGSND